MNRGGFSWRRLTGVSKAKSKISRTIGVPLTKSGRQQKLGRIASGGGCLFWLLIIMVAILTVFVVITLGRTNEVTQIAGQLSPWTPQAT